jgi:hypothetical protein
MFAALGSADKQKVTIRGANHYFSGPQGRAHIADCMATCGAWLAERGFSPG